MIASKRPSCNAVPGPSGQHRPVARQDRESRDRGQHVGRVVAAHPGNRPAQAQRRLGRRISARPDGNMPLISVRSTSPALAQRRQHAQLIAGELHVHVEFDPGEGGARRGGRAPPRRSAPGARRRPHGRVPRAGARCRRSARRGRPARSCRRHGASAASKLARVFPCSMWARPCGPPGAAVRRLQQRSRDRLAARSSRTTFAEPAGRPGVKR